MYTNLSSEIFTIQKKILTNICYYLYPMQEFIVLNYILNTLETEEDLKTDNLLKKFANGDRILEQLKAHKFIIEEKKDRSLTINQNFFIILDSVCKDMEESLLLERKKIEENSEKVVCKSCGKMREKYKVGFVRCECQQNEVTTVNTDNSEKLQGIASIQDMIKRVMVWKGQLDQKKKKEEQLFKAMMENSSITIQQVTDMKEIMKKTEKELGELKRRYPESVNKPLWNFQQLKPNGYFIRMAKKDYKPKRQFSKIKELETIRKRRKTQNSTW